jgi:hypothetical protein
MADLRSYNFQFLLLGILEEVFRKNNLQQIARIVVDEMCYY